ncbi:ribosomal protein S5 domain 2-like protein [Punctularia strigosozonata HHB-11173 SS5]|uniref:Ribosomal RNA-processing protein 42 n=1 Tax=Punctularia strigosozonata (strain HHB-11173) TaxID=741275 RepID=R7S172_PUNST|nr:ribosomal protein S5 domain 2-like protein [Punctularia strigosozonata HHB-11173 SS5]EIN04125.1 ribosomal protein S5 domain 2-like protein [Punctularia strigosozonata HHB-11173 SS5]
MTVLLSKAEKSYIQASLQADPSLRGDGRGLLDFRALALETGVSPLTNGSARVRIGTGDGGTEVLAAVKLEVEDVGKDDGVDGGRLNCSVTCLPSAYPHLAPTALDELSADLSALLHTTLAHPSLLPSNLTIIPNKKSWVAHLDCVLRSDGGNALDALFVAARAALWDTKVPRTRSVEYKAHGRGAGAGAAKGDDTAAMDVEGAAAGENEDASGFDTRQILRATDFELPDYWDEGEPLGNRERWPVCVTLNVLPPLYYLDATAPEEVSTPLRLVLLFSFPATPAEPVLQGMRLLGAGETDLSLISKLISEGRKHAQELHAALEVKLRDEDLRRNEKARLRFSTR